MADKPSERILVAAILGASVVLGALVFGLFFYESKDATNTIRVVGFASKRIESNVAKWSATLGRTVAETEMGKGYADVRRDMEYVNQRLKGLGASADQLTIQPVSAMPIYGKDGLTDKYQIRQTINWTSGDVSAVEKLALDPGVALGPNAVLQETSLQYLNSDLSADKRELIALATKDAIIRAQEIAHKSGIDIGKLVSAKTGVFQITAPNSTDISDFGVYDTTSRLKDMSVTVNTEFKLK
jgi:uncharacterized protein